MENKKDQRLHRRLDNHAFLDKAIDLSAVRATELNLSHDTAKRYISAIRTMAPVLAGTTARAQKQAVWMQILNEKTTPGVVSNARFTAVVFEWAAEREEESHANRIVYGNIARAIRQALFVRVIQ